VSTLQSCVNQIKSRQSDVSIQADFDTTTCDSHQTVNDTKQSDQSCTAFTPRRQNPSASIGPNTLSDSFRQFATVCDSFPTVCDSCRHSLVGGGWRACVLLQRRVIRQCPIFFDSFRCFSDSLFVQQMSFHPTVCPTDQITKAMRMQSKTD
jgi:hypothetical protein